MRISDWSSDVCSSDLLSAARPTRRGGVCECPAADRLPRHPDGGYYGVWASLDPDRYARRARRADRRIRSRQEPDRTATRSDHGHERAAAQVGRQYVHTTGATWTYCPDRVSSPGAPPDINVQGIPSYG